MCARRSLLPERDCSSTCSTATSPPPNRSVASPTYADKLSPGEWQLDWATPAVQLDRWVRAGHAWTSFRGKRLRVLAAEAADMPSDVPPPGALAEDGTSVGTGSGALRLVRVQPEGRGPMPWRDFANGARPAPGETFG